MQKLIISLDGLSAHDFALLLNFLPKSRKILDSASLRILDSGVLKTPQAIWAEIFTGERWYINGIAGYSLPVESLNSVHIASEKNLLAPLKLFSQEEPAQELKTAVVINFPLLEWNARDSAWLSDGTVLTSNPVFPSQLRTDECLSQYKPRPYPHFAKGFNKFKQSVDRCFEYESTRLHCAMRLLDQHHWSTFLLRLTVFDHLAHLVGLDYLTATDTFFFPRLQAVTAELDSCLFELLHRTEEWVIVSAYSHVPCLGKINLNEVLMLCGFLNLTSEVNAKSTVLKQRMDAVAAISEKPISPEMLSSCEEQLDAGSTVAGSPVAGCIYINSSERFHNGIVDTASIDSDFDSVLNDVLKTMTEELGSELQIESNPIRSASSQAPDLILALPGIEFHNMRNDSEWVSRDIPKTTHASKGFVLAPPTLAPANESIGPWEIANLWK